MFNRFYKFVIPSKNVQKRLHKSEWTPIIILSFTYYLVKTMLIYLFKWLRFYKNIECLITVCNYFKLIICIITFSSTMANSPKWKQLKHPLTMKGVLCILVMFPMVSTKMKWNIILHSSAKLLISKFRKARYVLSSLLYNYYVTVQLFFLLNKIG